jgi:hypothetical protein
MDDPNNWGEAQCEFQRNLRKIPAITHLLRQSIFLRNELSDIGMTPQAVSRNA